MSTAADLMHLVGEDVRSVLNTAERAKTPETVKLCWAVLGIAARGQVATTEQGQIGCLQNLTDTLLAVIPDPGQSPDARLLAQRLAQNIVRWNGDKGPVEVSPQAREMVASPMRLV